MSSQPTLRCLFCNHLNLAGARFCNECGSPLHLQPCNHCGAIDKRTASKCYKCGEALAVRTVPDIAALPAAPELAAGELGAGPAVSKIAAAPAPPVPGSEVAGPALNGGDVVIERTSLPEPAAPALSVFWQGLRREGTATPVQGDGVADRAPAKPDPDPAHATSEAQQADEAVPSDGAATASRRAWRIAVPALLFATAAVSVYFYHDRSAQPLADRQSAGSGAPSVLGGPVSSGNTSPTAATQVGATPAPHAAAPVLATGAEGVDKAPRSAASVATKSRTDPQPAAAGRPPADGASTSPPTATPAPPGAAQTARPSTVSSAEVKSRQAPPKFNECTEAVAALGFCNPGAKQGDK